MKPALLLALLLALVLGGGCAVPDPCEGTRDLADSPGGLTLLESEHPAGWGSSECFQCHQRWSVHRDDCLDGVAVGPIEADSIESCATCHGSNGVSTDTGQSR